MNVIDFRLIVDQFWFVFSGIPYTLGVALTSFLTGLVLGFFISRARMSKSSLLSALVRFYISVMRGVPMIVVLFVLYFGLPFYGVELPALLCSYLAFSLVSAAYISEIFRASMQAVDQGQWEAARALGLKNWTIVRKIILPQAIRIAIPPLGNVVLDMIKSTSLMAMITVQDIFQKAKIVGGRELDYMSMYVLVAFIYWLLCYGFEILQARLEKKLRIYS
ncbi:amino acid ABC transporter permease [Streptococcus panodentis]|uniref:Amino acid ABC transporter permease n=1 Tax=Streptococcus panodentis TaxID=1581472 RepID=A0ABS5B0F5_9STRE|nr:amino acid ABC transporter permease [Streptococcus panodentis]MBP2621963.1 amino acid ABC transporter permease [Streptococcus panodentis]